MILVSVFPGLFERRSIMQLFIYPEGHVQSGTEGENHCMIFMSSQRPFHIKNGRAVGFNLGSGWGIMNKAERVLPQVFHHQRDSSEDPPPHTGHQRTLRTSSHTILSSRLMRDQGPRVRVKTIPTLILGFCLVWFVGCDLHPAESALCRLPGVMKIAWLLFLVNMSVVPEMWYHLCFQRLGLQAVRPRLMLSALSLRIPSC